MTEAQQKKLLKDSLKNEVSPLLIGLRNELKRGNELLERMEATAGKRHSIGLNVNGKEILESFVEDGYTPVFGKDYFTDEHIASFLKATTPQKGVHYFTEKEAKDFLKQATPKKGKDYRDGLDGYTPVKGKDYFTTKEINAFMKACAPVKGVHYKDGAPGPQGKPGKDGTAISAIDIRNKLESLNGKERLKIKAIDMLEERLNALAMMGGDKRMPIGAADITEGGGTAGGITIVSTDPSTPTEGQQIINSTSGTYKIYYSGQWWVIYTFSSESDLLLQDGSNILLQDGTNILLN